MKAKQVSTRQASSKAKTEETALQGPRQLKMPKYQRGKFQKRVKHPGPKLASSWTILRRSLVDVKNNRKLFGSILAIYAGLSLLLVRGFNSTAQLGDTKAALQTGHKNIVSMGADLFGGLLSGSGTGATTAATYQTFLFILVSLVIIWALRHVYGRTISPAPVKAAFYKSTSSFVPFVIVLIVLSLQLIPLLVGTSLYGLLVGGGIVTSGLEYLVCLAVLLLLATWSFYMLTGSLFALYIVTLPNVGPLQALRSSRRLVQFRRWTVLRKLLFLPLMMFVALVVLMLPIVLLLTGLAEWIFFVLSLSTLIFGHSYLYTLYRELV